MHHKYFNSFHTTALPLLKFRKVAEKFSTLLTNVNVKYTENVFTLVFVLS